MANGVGGRVLWNDKGGGGGCREITSPSGEMQQTLLFDSGNKNIQVDFSFRSTDDTSMSSYEEGSNPKRLKFSQQGGSGESSEEQSAPIGLKLSKTSSFINLLERELNERRQKTPSPSPSAKQKMKEPMTDKDEKLDNEKLKASNFPALYLRIGNWERNSIHEGDLVAKCYYKKGRLVWEVLEGSLKSKIEIQWSDIIAIRASKADDESGILEIELNEKPLFFKETNPQPRKHTLWQQADDFTGGEALRYRRHYVKFAPGTLDKHYERLLQYDQRLSLLSQRPFPSKHSPYFTNAFGIPAEFSLDLNAYQSHIHPMGRYLFNQSFQASMASPPFQIVRQTTRPEIGFFDSNPTIPVRNIVLDNQNMAFVNEATNIANRNYVHVARPIASAVPNNMDFPNYPNMGIPDQDFAISQGQGTGLSTPDTTLLGIRNHLLADMQAMNEKTVLAGASPMCSSMHPLEIVRGRTFNEQAPMIQNIGENSIPNDGLLWSDPNWLHQYKDVAILPSTHDSFYPYGMPNQTNGNL